MHIREILPDVITEEIDKTKNLIAKINDRHIFPHARVQYMIDKDADGLNSLQTDDYYLMHMTGVKQSREVYEIWDDWKLTSRTAMYCISTEDTHITRRIYR